MPNFYIDDDNFKSLIGDGYWSIQDLPNDRAEQVRPFLASDDTIGVFASGCPPTSSPHASNVIGGIDWVRLESNLKPGEPPLNVYHFVIKQPDEHGYPVYACRNGNSIAPHWSKWKNIDVYLKKDDDPPNGG
jgi:hypothetical protein